MRYTLLLTPLVYLLSLNQALAAKPTPVAPIGSPGNWVMTSDYPASSLRAGEQGTVGFVLAVGPDGSVKTCTVTQSSGYSLLDGITCPLLVQRARFTPASDARGRPVAGSFASRVRWALPKDGPAEPPKPGEMLMSFTVNADGSIADCTFSRSGPMFAGQAARPDECDRNPRITKPYLDAAGNPVRKRVTMQMQMKVDDLP